MVQNYTASICSMSLLYFMDRAHFPESKQTLKAVRRPANSNLLCPWSFEFYPSSRLALLSLSQPRNTAWSGNSFLPFHRGLCHLNTVNSTSSVRPLPQVNNHSKCKMATTEADTHSVSVLTSKLFDCKITWTDCLSSYIYIYNCKHELIMWFIFLTYLVTKGNYIMQS